MTDDARFEMIRVRLLMGLTESARIEFQSHLEQVRDECRALRTTEIPPTVTGRTRISEPPTHYHP